MSELSELIERNKDARCPELKAAIARAEAAEARVRALEDYIIELAPYDYPSTSLLMKADEIAERRRG